MKQTAHARVSLEGKKHPRKTHTAITKDLLNKENTTQRTFCAVFSLLRGSTPMLIAHEGNKIIGDRDSNFD